MQQTVLQANNEITSQTHPLSFFLLSHKNLMAFFFLLLFLFLKVYREKLTGKRWAFYLLEKLASPIHILSTGLQKQREQEKRKTHELMEKYNDKGRQLQKLQVWCFFFSRFPPSLCNFFDAIEHVRQHEA